MYNKYQVNVIKTLIKFGVDINISRDSDGITALHLSCFNGCVEAAREICLHNNIIIDKVLIM